MKICIFRKVKLVIELKNLKPMSKKIFVSCGPTAKVQQMVSAHNLSKNILIKGDDIICSDGYHTIDELYDHRATLFIALCRLLSKESVPDTKEHFDLPKYDIWRSEVNGDGSAWEGYFVMGISREEGQQITYHIPMSRWEETNFAAVLDKAPDFDGHTPSDVLERLKML